MPAPFNISRQPLKFAHRPWNVSSFWSQYFPFNAQSEVYFVSPYDQGPIYKVESEPSSKSLERRLTLALLLTVIFGLVGFSAAFFFSYGTLWFLPLCYGWLGFILYFGRQVIAPLCLKGETSQLTQVDFSEVESMRKKGRGCTLTGESCLPYRYVKIWSAFLPSVITYVGVSFFFHPIYDVYILWCWILGALSLGVVPWGYWNLFYGEVPLKIAQSLVAAALYVMMIPFWVLMVEPDMYKDTPPWGFERSSPLSEKLSKVQGLFTAVNFDRRIQYMQYTPFGVKRDIARYSISPEEFEAVLSDVRKSPWLRMEDGGDDEERKNLMLKRFAVEKFPEWWNVSSDIRYMVFESVENHESPLDERQISLIYDLPTQQLFVINEEVTRTPYERMKRS